MSYSDDSLYEKRNLKSFSNGDISCHIIGLEKQGIQMLSQISSRISEKMTPFAMTSEKEVLETSTFKNQCLLQEEVTVSDDPNKMSLDPLLLSIAENNATLLLFLMPAHQAKTLVPKIAIHAKQQKSISFVLLFSTETNQEAREKELEEGVNNCKDFFDGIIPISEKLRYENAHSSQNQKIANLADIMCKDIRILQELICDEGVINVDIEDVFTLLERPHNLLHIHTVLGFGKNRAQTCISEYLKELNDQQIKLPEQAHIIMLNLSISSLEDFSMEELDVLVEGIRSISGDETEIIFGVNVNEKLPKDNLKFSAILSSSMNAHFMLK